MVIVVYAYISTYIHAVSEAEYSVHAFECIHDYT